MCVGLALLAGGRGGLETIKGHLPSAVRALFDPSHGWYVHSASKTWQRQDIRDNRVMHRTGTDAEAAAKSFLFAFTLTLASFSGRWPSDAPLPLTLADTESDTDTAA